MKAIRHADKIISRKRGNDSKFLSSTDNKKLIILSVAIQSHREKRLSSKIFRQRNGIRYFADLGAEPHYLVHTIALM